MPATTQLPPPELASLLPQALLELSSDGLAICDWEGRVMWANPRLGKLIGQPPERTRGRCLLDLLQVAGPDVATRELLRAALLRGEGFQGVELQHQRADDGSPATSRLTARAERSAGEPQRWLFALADITELHRLRQEQAHQREVLEMAQEFGRIGIWQRDIATGAGRWDRHMFEFFGIDPRVGPPPLAALKSYLHPDDRAEAGDFTSFEHAGQYSARYRLLRADGSVRHIHSSWRVKNGPHGRPEHAVGVLLDDTETWALAQSYDQAAAQLRLSVDLGNIALWRHDLATNLMHHNDRAYEMLMIEKRPGGMPIAEVRKYVHPDDLQLVIDSAGQALRTNQPVDVRCRYIRADGSIRDALTRRVVQRNAAGEPIAFVGVTLDLTDQVAALRHSLELTRSLELATAAAGLGIWTGEIDGSGASWNAQQYAICGLQPRAVPPVNEEFLRSIVHPDDRRAVAREWDSALRKARRDGQYSVDTAHRIVWPDGTVRWVSGRYRIDMSTPPGMVVGITLDTTERHEAEAKLREAHERAAFATKGVGIGTWELVPPSELAIWDEQMYRLRGLQPSDGPMTVDERLALVHPEDLPRVLQARQAARQSGGVTGYEFRVRWPDGSWRWLASRTLPVFDEEAGSQRWIGVNWDITEVKNAAAALRERELALRESEAKSQFLSRMSHELRTPLNAVLGFTQLLQADDDGSLPARSTRLNYIRGAGEHLLTLINEVLDLSSLESGELKLELVAVPTADALREALPLVQQLAREKDVTIEVGELPGTLRVDRTRIRQVLLNLLSNAIKYNRPQGRVVVRGRQDGARVELEIIDTGRGMSPLQVQHLFEPFNRLGAERDNIEGTGIGLVIVKVLVERMGGEIALRSEPGVGSVFTLRLTSAEAGGSSEPASAGPDLAASVPSQGAVRNGVLLYIEDNPINTRLVQELVAQRDGLTLACEPDGHSGIARAAAMQPDLILIDMQLPDMDGHEVLRRLREQVRTAATPCIALSANAMPEEIERALDAGFSDYWTKPINVLTFMSALDALFAA